MPGERHIHIDLHVHHPITVNLAGFQQAAEILSQLTIIQQAQENLMSQITDFAAREKAAHDVLGAKLDAVITGVANLDALIQAFQNSPGTLSAADQAALDDIETSSAALLDKANAIDVTVPGTFANPNFPNNPGNFNNPNNPNFTVNPTAPGGLSVADQIALNQAAADRGQPTPPFTPPGPKVP